MSEPSAGRAQEGAGLRAPCELLDWDSDFFGMRIARLLPARIEPRAVAQAASWARSAGVRCLYWLADPDGVDSLLMAQEVGFRLVDVRVELERQLARPPAEVHPDVRLLQPDDVPGLVRIARASHHESRFYADPGFPNERCDDLYATWIEKSCAGWADAVQVARSKEDEPIGYLSCHAKQDGSGQIGLVAVGREARGRGIGRGLVDASLRWFAQRDLASARVVTQARNVGALRLYETAGFRTASVRFWFHLWPSDRE